MQSTARTQHLALFLSLLVLLGMTVVAATHGVETPAISPARHVDLIYTLDRPSEKAGIGSLLVTITLAAPTISAQELMQQPKAPVVFFFNGFKVEKARGLCDRALPATPVSNALAIDRAAEGLLLSRVCPATGCRGLCSRPIRHPLAEDSHGC